jgi:hypothetical protein
VISSASLAVKHIKRIKWNNPPIGMHNVDAGTLHRTDIEVKRVEKLYNHHPEYIFVGNSFRNR